VSDKSLTIVLPVYNGEARLRACVHQILDLASELTTKFAVVIIDDGSTDATFEIAEELAAVYPQVSLLRHRARRGLGATIEYAQRRIRSEAIIVHDGVTPIDPNQVRNLWRRYVRESAARDSSTATTATMQSAICDFANLPAIHAAMEQAHHRVVGFQWLTPQSDDSCKRFQEARVACDKMTGAPHFQQTSGMGRIPALPRPKFLSALADFAFGE
jgi:glycosyltransferase involved in cell wall biosynthesis